MSLPKQIEEDDHDDDRRKVRSFGLLFGFAEAGWNAFEYIGRATGILAPVVPNASETEDFRVGEYFADYSLLKPEDIAKTDAECEALFKRSKPVSR